MSGTVVGIGDKAVNKMDRKKNLYFMGLALVLTINEYK